MGPRKKYCETPESSNAYIPLRRKSSWTQAEAQWDGTKQGKAITKISTETESDGVWGFKLGANTRSLKTG
ncbi:hypothetical protein CY34DRAFT_810810 [Suillus luteus UH-Slu-Lm8-n1]|uniref:Uncharacterized protein n=1 Tax=Suillus luteus UH-Slu-Lm8-n1 TaxID=930992 RepID=A0A0D0AYS9_9AGAM|nr:hypothetical protein CY34DRAFT_810810 [Suillus luteus UH-Slu-Lm8-n1]